MSELDRGWKDAGSAWLVSGTKRDLGVGRESCEPALGPRLRGPEECVAWAGLTSAAVVLWSAGLGTAPSVLEADGAGSALLSCWYGSLAVKTRRFIQYLETKTT